MILAGGRSSRMGHDKAFLEVHGAPLIERQIESLRRVFTKFLIVTNAPEKYIGFKGVKIVRDIIPDMGPLGGIYSGLLSSGYFHNFVVACDMPFINEPLVKYMLKNRNGYDVLIPKIAGRYHPLFGVYSKGCIQAIEKALRHNRLKVASIFSEVRTRFLSGARIRRFDKEMLSLLNINTPGEFRRINKNSLSPLGEPASPPIVSRHQICAANLVEG